MFTQFRDLYPQCSLISEFVTTSHGKFIVRVMVQEQGVTIATGLAGADTVEEAEDKARHRALALLGIPSKSAPKKTTPPPVSEDKPLSSPVPSWRETLPPPEFLTTAAPDEEYDATVSQNRIEEILNSPTPSIPGSETTPMSEEISAFSTVTVVAEEPRLEVTEEAVSENTTKSIKKQKKASTSSILPQEDPRIEQIDREMVRLNWTRQQGVEHLLQTYGKKSRLHLTDQELQEFLEYLLSL